MDRWRTLAERLADTAASVVMPHFRRVGFDDKADASPVTIADRDAEAAMRAIIEAEAPDHGIIGEEYGRLRPDAEYVWALDPIDGTKSFITGRPLFGTLIALCRRGRPVLGVIDCPAAGERWVGADGRTTYRGYGRGEIAKTRGDRDIASAILAITSPAMLKTDDDRARFGRVANATKFTVWGGDCHCYGTLASGLVDVVIEASLSIYDFAALVPVVENAGGVMSDWSGRPLDFSSGGHVLAAGDATLHRAAVKLLSA